MIVWGTKRQSELAGFATGECAHCGGPSLFGVIEQRKKFSLYFVPVLTYSRDQTALCASCGVEGYLKPGTTIHPTEHAALQALENAARRAVAPALPSPAQEWTLFDPARAASLKTDTNPEPSVIRTAEEDLVIPWEQSADSRRPVSGDDGQPSIVRTYTGDTRWECVQKLEQDDRDGGRKSRVVEAAWVDEQPPTLRAAFGDPARTYHLLWPEVDRPLTSWTAPPEVSEQTGDVPVTDERVVEAPPVAEKMEHVPSATGDAAPTTKKCPDCAETILADARICRFCRYEYWPADRSRTA